MVARGEIKGADECGMRCLQTRRKATNKTATQHTEGESCFVRVALHVLHAKRHKEPKSYKCDVISKAKYPCFFFFFFFFLSFFLSRSTETWNTGSVSDRKQSFIRKSLPPCSGSSCLQHFQELARPSSLFVSSSNSNPKEKYPGFHPARSGGGGLRREGVEDYCFPICCPEQTRPYQSKPAQLLFHMALMYWKAFHSRLPLAAAAEQVSVARIPQWRTIALFC